MSGGKWLPNGYQPLQRGLLQSGSESRRIAQDTRSRLILNEDTRQSEPRDVPVSVVVGELEIPELGNRQALGVQALDSGSGEDLVKGAGSDSLKKCASLFGVPLEG